MAEGIRKRHSKGCPAKGGARCNCKAGWEASIYLSREGRKLRRTFAREAEAKSWRSDALTAARAGSLRAPSSITVEQAAWLWLEGTRNGSVRDRSGHIYKPGTVREYGRSLGLRVLPEFGANRLSELTRADIQGFVDRLLTQGLAPSTIANTVNPLQAIYRHAVRRDLVAINPTRDVELPAARGRRERIASAAEAARLLKALPDRDRGLGHCLLRRAATRRAVGAAKLRHRPREGGDQSRSLLGSVRGAGGPEVASGPPHDPDPRGSRKAPRRTVGQLRSGVRSGTGAPLCAQEPVAAGRTRVGNSQRTRGRHRQPGGS